MVGRFVDRSTCGQAADGCRKSADGRLRTGGDPPRMLRSAVIALLPRASLFSLDGRPRYIHEGWFLISVANLTVILLMIAAFVLALVLPFPHGKDTR